MDPVLQDEAQRLLLIGTRLDFIHSLLLGFLICSMFSSLPFDWHLIRSLFTTSFNLFVFLNRLTYLVVKYIGRSYFIIAVLLTQIPRKVDCNITTRTHQIIFYVSLVANHWLFCLRTLATWRGHSRYRHVLTFALVGLLALIAGAAVNIWDGKVGHVIEPFGCVYLLYGVSLPRLSLSITLVTIGIFFHTTNMILAAMRLSSFSETIGDAEVNIPSWASLAANLSTNVTTMLRGRTSLASKQFSGVALAEILIKQGFHQWIMHLVCLVLFIFLPIFAFRNDPIIVMAGVSIYTAADIELGSHIFRATSTAMRTPLPEQATSTFFSSRALERIPMGRSRAEPTSPLTSPLSSRDRILTVEKPCSPSRAHFRQEEQDRATPLFPCNRFNNNSGFESHV